MLPRYDRLGTQQQKLYTATAAAEKAGPPVDGGRVFTGDPNIRPLRRSASMTTGEPTGTQNSTAFAAMFRVGAGGLTPTKAAAGRHQRADAAAAAPAAPASPASPLQRPRNPIASQLLFKAGRTESSPAAAQRRRSVPSGSSASPKVDLVGSPTFRGFHAAHGCAADGTQAPATQTSFMFGSPTASMSGSPAQQPEALRPRVQPPKFSFTAKSGSEAKPSVAEPTRTDVPAAKRRSPTKSPDRPATASFEGAARPPPAVPETSDFLLSRQFGGVNLNECASTRSTADTSLASKLQQASLGASTGETLANQFVEAIRLRAVKPENSRSATAAPAVASTPQPARRGHGYGFAGGIF